MLNQPLPESSSVMTVDRLRQEVMQFEQHEQMSIQAIKNIRQHLETLAPTDEKMVAANGIWREVDQVVRAVRHGNTLLKTSSLMMTFFRDRNDELAAQLRQLYDDIRNQNPDNPYIAEILEQIEEREGMSAEDIQNDRDFQIAFELGSTHGLSTLEGQYLMEYLIGDREVIGIPKDMRQMLGAKLLQLGDLLMGDMD